MSHNKKLVILLLILTLIFTFVACQNEKTVKDSMQTDIKTNENVEYTEKEVLKEKKIINNKRDIQVSRLYEYDDYGRLVKVKVDYKGDTSVVERYKYNNEGKKVYSYKSNNEDGLEEKIDYKYNDDGQLVKKVIKTADGYIQTEKYKYDEAGNKIREVDNREQDGELLAEFEKKLKYNDNHKLLELKLFRNDKLIRTEEYDYDDKGNKILEKINGEYALSGKEHSKWNEWEYDDSGNLLKKLVKNKNGDIIKGKKYKYDDNNREIKKIYLTKNGEIEKTDKIIYDEKEQLVKSFLRDASGKMIIETISIYNENHNKKKFIMKKNKELSDINKYEYDEQGNRTKSIWIDIKDGEKVIDQIREYKYDKYGNVIFKLHKNKDGVELLRETQEFYGEDEKKYSKMILKFDDGSLRGVYEK
jgi:YD repeat-containing protein